MRGGMRGVRPAPPKPHSRVLPGEAPVAPRGLGPAPRGHPGGRAAKRHGVDLHQQHLGPFADPQAPHAPLRAPQHGPGGGGGQVCCWGGAVPVPPVSQPGARPPRRSRTWERGGGAAWMWGAAPQVRTPPTSPGVLSNPPPPHLNPPPSATARGDRRVWHRELQPTRLRAELSNPPAAAWQRNHRQHRHRHHPPSTAPGGQAPPPAPPPSPRFSPRTAVPDSGGAAGGAQPPPPPPGPECAALSTAPCLPRAEMDGVGRDPPLPTHTHPAPPTWGSRPGSPLCPHISNPNLSVKPPAEQTGI